MNPFVGGLLVLEGIGEGFESELGVEAVAPRDAEHLPCVEVHNGGEVEASSIAHGYEGGIGYENLSRGFGSCFEQEVFSVDGDGYCGADRLGFDTGDESESLHGLSDSFSADLEALVLQMTVDASVAISAIFLACGFDVRV